MYQSLIVLLWSLPSLNIEPTTRTDIYFFVVVFIKGVIEWPNEDEAPPEDARDLVTRLLEQDPIVRLGTTGAWTSMVLNFASTRDHT